MKKFRHETLAFITQDPRRTEEFTHYSADAINLFTCAHPAVPMANLS